ncbi:MAG: hypothetical protein ACRD2C_23425 [Acidimicrobiales bacterium]
MLGAGEEGVEVVEEGVLVVFGEFGGFGNPGFEEVGGGVEGAAGSVVEDEVAEASMTCSVRSM